MRIDTRPASDKYAPDSPVRMWTFTLQLGSESRPGKAHALQRCDHDLWSRKHRAMLHIPVLLGDRSATSDYA